LLSIYYYYFLFLLRKKERIIERNKEKQEEAGKSHQGEREKQGVEILIPLGQLSNFLNSKKELCK